jgi:hypothetical protein
MKTLRTSPQTITDALEAHLATRFSALREATAIVAAAQVHGLDGPLGTIAEHAEASLCALRSRSPALARMLAAGYPVTLTDVGDVQIDPTARGSLLARADMMQAGWTAPSIFPTLAAGSSKKARCCCPSKIRGTGRPPPSPRSWPSPLSKSRRNCAAARTRSGDG